MPTKKKRKPRKERAPTVAIAAQNAVGRPTDYEPAYVEQVYKLCLLGAKDKEIADFFGVDERTINRWKIEHAEFCQSMRRGKLFADAVIASSLYHRAKGYEHPETWIGQYQGAVITKDLTKHYPPDTAAASLWLRNRQPDKWRDKVDLEHAGPGGGKIQQELSGEVELNLTPLEHYLRMLRGGE